MREIEAIIGAARGSLSMWLKPYPLTEEEKQTRSKTAKRYVAPKKSHGIESKHYQSVLWQNLTNQQKGRIAEAAVYFRLVLHGFEVYASMADGDKADWVVEVPESGSIHKIQVRCVTSPWKHGLPGINLRCAQGHNKLRRYAKGEFDFIVGYYLFNDTAYVYSFNEVARHKAFIAISEEHAERWDKLRA